MHKTRKAFGVVLVTHNQTAKILQPGEQPLSPSIVAGSAPVVCRLAEALSEAQMIAHCSPVRSSRRAMLKSQHDYL